MALTHLLNYVLLFFQKFLLFGDRAFYDVCMTFTYFFSLCGPFPKRWGRNICFLNTRCPSLGWKDRMDPCSSLPQRLEALLSKTFWCLGLYLRGPEGDMRCSTGSCPEQCVLRIANTSRTPGKVPAYTCDQYLWRGPRGLYSIRNKSSFCQLCFGRNSALLSELTSLNFCHWGGLLANTVSQITLLPPTLEAPGFVTEVTGQYWSKKMWMFHPHFNNCFNQQVKSLPLIAVVL